MHIGFVTCIELVKIDVILDNSSDNIYLFEENHCIVCKHTKSVCVTKTRCFGVINFLC